MKIQKTTQPATFQPVVLTIKIESEEELQVLTNIVSARVSNTMAMVRYGCLDAKDQPLAQKILGAIYEALYEAPRRHLEAPSGYNPRVVGAYSN